MSKAAEQAITTVPSDRSLPHRRALLAGLAAIVPTAAIAATIPAMSSPEADSELIALGRRVSDLRAQERPLISVVVNPTGAYEVYTDPVALVPNSTINISANITSSSSGDFAVEYNVREIYNNNATNIIVNAVRTFTANVPLLVNLSALIPSTVPDGTYRVDVLIYPPDYSSLYSYAQQANIFYVQSSAITTLPMKLGVYRSAQDPVAIKIYENWLGRRVDYILDTVPSGDYGDATLDISWQKFVGSGWSWFASRWAGNESRMILTIPMLPTQGNYGSPSLGATAAGAALSSGASGSYDSYWVTMGTNLVSAGYANNYIRLGWEMNGSWYNWSAVFNPTAWTAYFQRIVNILRATTGANFKFVFNPTMGYQNIDSTSIYPGNSYVDVIALDVYDQDYNGYYPILATDTPAQALVKQQNVWANDMVKTFNPLDMLFWKDYAVTNSKPFMICEWGCYAINYGNGGGDDAYFIQQMHDFAVANDIAMLCYFDYAGLQALFNSLLTPTQFPYASALYQQLFGPTG